MNCDEAKQMLAGYADGELSSIENEGLAAHLEQCGRCRQIVHDQQRVQHVLDSYQPPPVEDAEWNEVAKRLRAELEGTGEPVQLKTRSRIEGLEPTPEAAPPARDVPAPAARPRTAAAARQAPAILVHKVRPRKGRQPFRWMAHAAGAVAACLVMALGLATLWVETAPPLEASALARQDDVAIIEIEMLDADHNLVLFAGDATDVAAIWVVPSEPDG